VHDRIKTILAQTIGKPAENIPDNARINEIPEWDSLRNLEFMLALEKEFKIKIPAFQMINLKSLDAIQDYIKTHA
jgi:acyl carrier protein